MVSNAETVQFDNDDVEPNDFEEDFGEENTEEYEAEDVFSGSSTHLSVEPPIEQPTTATTKLIKSSTDTISTNYSAFESSSSMKSVFSAISYPSDLSQSNSNLQTPNEVADNVSLSEIDSTSFIEIENRMESYSVRTHSLNEAERKVSTTKINRSESLRKFAEIPFLHEILEQVLFKPKFMFIKSKVLFNEILKISIINSKTQSEDNLSPAQNLWLPEEDFAGEFTLNIDHFSSGVLVETCGSFIEGSYTKGTSLFAKLTNNLKLIEEKKTEFQQNENERQEKALHVCMEDENYLTFRFDKLNDTEERFRGHICINDQNDFVLDGNLFGLMRHFIAANYFGCFQCYSISITGRVLRQVFWIKDKTSIKINHELVQVIPLRKSSYDYFTNKVIETSKTFYTSKGAMIYHTWQHSPYIVHMDPIELKHKRKLSPCMELTWRSDNLLKSLFEIEKCSADCQLRCYLEKCPEIVGFLNDFLISLLHKKPKSVLGYTCDFFE